PPLTAVRSAQFPLITGVHTFRLVCLETLTPPVEDLLRRGTILGPNPRPRHRERRYYQSKQNSVCFHSILDRFRHHHRSFHPNLYNSLRRRAKTRTRWRTSAIACTHISA